MTPIPTLADLPSPPSGKTGWPWTQETPHLSPTLPDGKEWPRISIVTPSFNQGEYLEETIRSILLQGYPNLEYIIMDGGSTDESAAIINKYQPWLSYWVSEKDEGQPHAINKGLAISTGLIFNWINSDDFLVSGALAQIAVAFGQGDAVAGDIIYFGEGEDVTGVNKKLSPERIMRDGGNFFQQPAIWLRREKVQRCGGVDERFHYAFDWDLAIRYFYSHSDVAYLNTVLVHFRLHGASKTISQREKFQREMTEILQKLSVLQEFKSLHAFCVQLIQRRMLYSLITKAMFAQSRRPLRQLLRLGLRKPQVLRTRFFWGALRQAVPTPIRSRNS